MLLSRPDPSRYGYPTVELGIYLNKKLKVFDINVDEIYFKLRSPTREQLRLLHPLLLDDGSLITHQPEPSKLLKFDKCRLIKSKVDNGYHHSIEMDK